MQHSRIDPSRDSMERHKQVTKEVRGNKTIPVKDFILLVLFLNGM